MYIYNLLCYELVQVSFFDDIVGSKGISIASNANSSFLYIELSLLFIESSVEPVRCAEDILITKKDEESCNFPI